MDRKVVKQISPSGESIVLAFFSMKGGRLDCTWAAPRFKEEMENFGVVAYDHSVYPKDGQAFYDALDRAFSNSTFRFVTTER
jgi:hypothetical protein